MYIVQHTIPRWMRCTVGQLLKRLNCASKSWKMRAVVPSWENVTPSRLRCLNNNHCGIILNSHLPSCMQETSAYSESFRRKIARADTMRIFCCWCRAVRTVGSIYVRTSMRIVRICICVIMGRISPAWFLPCTFYARWCCCLRLLYPLFFRIIVIVIPFAVVIRR